MDPLPLLQELIRCPSITPADAGAMAVLEAALTPLGFTCTRLRFGEIENLFARRGTAGPHLCFAGHTDVVPPGDVSGWTADPFGAEVRDGTLYGRGAVDMKGGIAAWIAAVASLPADLPGSLSLLITGDEEGPATDGTVRVLEWMAANGQVPPGDVSGWTADPFGAEVRDGTLYGRGAVDMKGGIAAWIAAVASLPADLPGSLSLLITGDEEGPATDGTVRVLEWMAANGQVPDCCIVGEPTSKAVLGDTIKIGRRGSMNVSIALHGVQGHSAYPQRADNPIHRLVRVLHSLTATPLDQGSEWFEATTLQVTSFDVGNPATNVIPPLARARLNIRFNDLHSSASLTARIRAVLDGEGARYDLDVSCSGESFLTQPGPFVEALQRATRAAAGVEPQLDTGGGTSDARFIARYCPVAELGAVGTTMHKADEATPVEELRALSRLYAAVIAALQVSA